MTPAEFIDNPDWAGFIPEFSESTRARHLPTHEDCSQLDIAAVAGNLRCGGALGSMRGYEERLGQIDMAGAIANAFNQRMNIMIEAGTGVGKSLAYLVPSIMWAWTNDTPVIISTATRNLQSQLIGADIPKALRILGDDARKFKVALLKGRSNYLCLRELAEFFAAGFWTMSKDEQEQMPALIDWLQKTKDGDLDSYDGLPRSVLSCTGDECSGRRCQFYSRCFVYKARRLAADAHLVIANHALVLAESSGGGILPAYSRVIFDEAHNLEAIATEYFSYEFSMPALIRILNRLMRRGKGKRSRPGGVVTAIERQFQKGAFSASKHSKRIMELLKEIAACNVRVVNATERLSEVVEALLAPAKERECCRYRVAMGRRQYSNHGMFVEYGTNEWDEAKLLIAQNDFESQMGSMVKTLYELHDTLNEVVSDGELNYLGDLISQVEAIAEGLKEFVNAVNFVLLGSDSNYAYWIERVRADRKASHLRMVAAPLSVAEELKRAFYERKDTVALCSATLRVGNDFRYMAKRLGCGERFQMLTAISPFNYLRQAIVLAPDCLPDPTADAQGYAKALAEMMKDLFSITKGRALVLFTSYEMMNAVAGYAHQLLADCDIRLLVQGEGLSREAMTRHLKEDGNTVIFGAQSFWEGVDVSGDALSCVVLARLPFAQIGDPVIEARSEKIDREGGSSFRDYLLPEAVIKFRQGFGRLIRTKTDRGAVIITDPRLVTKNYGAIFRKSIPASVHTIVDIQELLRRVSDFFAE